MLINIVSHTPLWVWALLAGLLVLGWTQTRQRRVSRLRMLGLPLALLLMGLWNTSSSFAAAPLAGLLWLLALAGGVVLGRRRPLPAAARWLAAERRLQLPGSWLPLLLTLLIFALRYGSAVLLALHPAWAGAPGVLVPLAALYGAISGLLLGRTLGLLRLTLAAPAAAIPARMAADA